MIRAEKQQAQDMIRAEKRQAQDAHDRAIENLTIQLYERWRRTSAGPYFDEQCDYIDQRSRCQAEARTRVNQQRRHNARLSSR